MLLTGCATVSHIPLSQNDSNTVKTIYVNPEIKKPEKPFVFGSGPRIALAFGVIGGIASGLTDESTKNSMLLFMHKNQIDISNIVYQQWMKQLATKSRFKLIDKTADAVLETDVIVYGITLPHGLATYFNPILTLNAKLIRHNKVIWQDSKIAHLYTSGLPKYKLDAIMSDPKVLQIMWNKTAEKLISQMVVDINK